MVYIAQYTDGVVSCFTDELNRSYGLSYQAELEQIGTVTYKTQAELDTLALQAIEDAKPKVVSRVQAMKAMKLTGTLWVDFNTLLGSNQDAKDEWDLATELQRNNDLTLALSATLNLTSTDLDDLFQLASTL